MRAFESAAALANHMQGTPYAEQNGFLYSALMAGLVVTYMRPFKESGGKRGLNELPESFSHFDSDRLRDAHEELSTARNKLYAHIDVTYGARLKIEPDSARAPFETLISFRETDAGRFEIIPSVTVPEISPDTILPIAELIELQITRGLKETARILKAMARGQMDDASKVYKVGVDFP